MVQKVLVQDRDIERLVAGPRPGAGLPQLHLHDGIRPGVSRTQSKGVAQLNPDSPVHDVAVDERPQQSDLFDREHQWRPRQEQMVRCWGA